MRTKTHSTTGLDFGDTPSTRLRMSGSGLIGMNITITITELTQRVSDFDLKPSKSEMAWHHPHEHRGYPQGTRDD